MLHSRKNGLVARIKKLHSAHVTWAYLASKYSGTKVECTLSEVMNPGQEAARNVVDDNGKLTSFGVREVSMWYSRTHAGTQLQTV